MNFKPCRSHYIRPEMVEDRDTDSSAVAYRYDVAGKPAALCFSGKRQKPDSRFYYLSEASREQAIADHRAGVRRSEAFAVEQREKRKAAGRAAAGLVVPADGYMSGAAVAVFLRLVLKEAFPGQRFSVTSSGSLRITWTDGPARSQVEPICNTFAGSYFDGMIDYKGSIHHAIDGQKVRFGSDFVFCERTMSREALEIGAAALAADWNAQNAGRTNYAAATIEDRGTWLEVVANPDFPGTLPGRFAGEYEFSAPESDDLPRRFHRAAYALELWFNQARPVTVQPSPTLARVQVLGSDGYGNTALPAADGGETGRGYPRPKEPADAPAMRAAIEQAAADIAAEIRRAMEEDSKPRRVDCEVIDFAPHLASHRARADAARRLN